MAKISASGVRLSRGPKLVLRDVNVSASAGEVLGILGPSGAGKSTLFRAIVGELKPEGGTIALDERDITELPLWQRARLGIGYVPQTPSVLWDLTVRENLDVYLRLATRRSAERTSVDALAARVELEAQRDVPAGRLSGGERRRLELARALVMDPKILVCDEPFAGVDPRGAERIGALLADLARAGVAVILADHHVTEALAICTRAVLLLDGAVLAEGAPAAFVEHPLVRGRYLGTLHA
jgi:lipopolysaccharide export system ATP-binding protein